MATTKHEEFQIVIEDMILSGNPIKREWSPPGLNRDETVMRSALINHQKNFPNRSVRLQKRKVITTTTEWEDV